MRGRQQADVREHRDRSGTVAPRRSAEGIVVMLLSLLAATARAQAAVNVWTPAGATDGSVACMAIDPARPAILYAGTFNTVFKSTNSGASWQASGSGLPAPNNIQITVLAVDPLTTTTIYAGTTGFGVFKSTDGASSWRQAGGRTLEGVVHALQIVPMSPATLYAATVPSGLVRSTDGGASWQVLNAEIGGVPLAIDPAMPTTLYAGRSKSTDGGGSWFPIDDGLPNVVLPALAIDPLAPATVYVGTRREGVFKTTDGGASWSVMNTGLPDPNITALAVDSATAGIVYAGTVGDGVFKSTDGGITWFALPGVPDGDVTALLIDPATPSMIYAAAAGQAFSLQQDGPRPSITPAPTPPLTINPSCSLRLDPDHGPAGSVTHFSARCPEIHSGGTANLYFGTTWLGTVIGDSGGLVADDVPLPVPADAPLGALLLRLVRGARIAVAAFDVQQPDLTPTPTPADTPTPRATPDTWSFAGPGGGVVRALTIDPTNPNVLYAGTEPGGILKSSDRGVSWGVANRGLPARVEVRAVAVDPAAPRTLYAGTQAFGVFRTNDGGANWTAASTGLSSLDVNALVVDPAAPSTLYAGTKDADVFKSTDGGTHWFHAGTGLGNAEIKFLAIDPSSPATLYAATEGARVFKTTDGGAHWQAAESAPRYVNALAIDPLTPSTVYAASFSISKSTDAGATWVDASEGIRYSNGTPGIQIIGLTIESTSPARLLAATLDAGVFASTDGAATWSPQPASPAGMYAFATDPAAPHVVYAGGYGMFQSADSGRTWRPTGLTSLARVVSLTVDATDPATVYAVTWSDGVLKSTDGSATWSRASTGLPSLYICDVVIDPASRSIVLAGTDEGVFRSTDAGASWRTTDVIGQTPTLAVAPTSPPTLLASTYLTPVQSYDLLRSTDAGTTWQPVGFAPSVGRLAVDRRDPTTMYAGTVQWYEGKYARISKSTDTGVHWTPTNLPSFDDVYPLAVDIESSAIVYAGYRAGLLKTTDAGATWRAFNTGLSEGRVSELLVDPLDPRLLYASNGQLFTSTDGGSDWSPFSNGLTGNVSALGIDSGTGATLYAGTSDGVFVLHRTDLDPTRATPTPTPTADPRCSPDQITLVPTVAPPGARVMLTGFCYALHDGVRTDVYFDATHVGWVTGDSGGSYALEFNVPSDALPGLHHVRVVGAQSVAVVVEPDNNMLTPTPTPGPSGYCSADDITVVPNAGPPGTRVVVSGQCYYLHSGRGGQVLFDDTSLGSVHGETGGNWVGAFVIPSDAVTGTHLIKLAAFGPTYQLAAFEVEATVQTPTATRTPTAKSTATSTPTTSATSTVSATPSRNAAGGGGCSVTPQPRAAAAPFFICVPVALRAGRLVRKRNRVFAKISQGGKRS